MSNRQTQRPLPPIWLMTDARFGDGLLRAIRRLPLKSGVIFRHYHLSPVARRTLFNQVKRICRLRGHMLFLASDERTAILWHADGFHAPVNQRRSRYLPRSAPVHNIREMAGAQLKRADMVLVSPVFVTASHPGARCLGQSGLMRLAASASNMNVIALGGMTRRRASALDKRTVNGWAGIDAFITKAQNRILVPT